MRGGARSLASARLGYARREPLGKRSGEGARSASEVKKGQSPRRLPSGVEAVEGEYKDIPGFCKSAGIELIREHEYILTPGRYVGIEEKEDDGEPFEEKMQRLTEGLAEEFAKGEKLEEKIRGNLKGIGFEI